MSSTGSTTAPTPKYSKNQFSGSSGAYTEVYFCHSNTDIYEYKCSAHSGMGQSIIIDNDGDLIVKNDGTIGSIGDNDAIAISSTGTVTLDQTSVHSRGLDVKDITNTSQSGFIKLYDNDNSNYIQLKSSGTVNSDFSLILPSADGSSGQFLKTDGSGNLSFDSVLTSI